MGENRRRLIAEQITAFRCAGLEVKADRLTTLLASECDVTPDECELVVTLERLPDEGATGDHRLAGQRARTGRLHGRSRHS